MRNLQHKTLLILFLLGFLLIAQEPPQKMPGAKQFNYDSTVERERPELNEETKRLIAAYRRNPTKENYDALQKQVEKGNDAVIARKKATLEDLKQHARQQSKVDEMHIRLTAPADGAEECLLTPIQLKYVKMPRAARRVYFADTDSRKEMKSEGFYPRGVELAWEKIDGVDEYTVILSSNADFAQGTCREYTTKEHGIKVDNLMIGTKYFWKVKGGNAKSEVSTFVTSDIAPRLLRVPKLWNVRDLGGRVGLDGRRVKQNMAFRSSGLNYNAEILYYTKEELKEDGEAVRRDKAFMDKKGRVAKRDADGNKRFNPGKAFFIDDSREFMHDVMGIRTDIDLRSDDECLGMTGSPLGADVQWLHIPSHAYAGINSDIGRKAFAEVFKVFLDEKNYPLDFHCISGQDRTGAVAFIINGLLGVCEEELFLDWEVTGFKSSDTNFRHETGLDKLYNVFNQYEGATINERIEKYVLSLGFTKGDIQHFRDIMLEK